MAKKLTNRDRVETIFADVPQSEFEELERLIATIKRIRPFNKPQPKPKRGRPARRPEETAPIQD